MINLADSVTSACFGEGMIAFFARSCTRIQGHHATRKHRRQEKSHESFRTEAAEFRRISSFDLISVYVKCLLSVSG